MPASVTVEGGGSGSYLDCFLDASLEQPPGRYFGKSCLLAVACVAGHGASRTSDLHDGISCAATTASLRDILVYLMIWPVDVDALGAGL